MHKYLVKLGKNDSNIIAQTTVVAIDPVDAGEIATSRLAQLGFKKIVSVSQLIRK